MRGLWCIAVGGLVLLGLAAPANSQVESYPTTLEVGTATGTSVGGSVDSPKRACLRNRKVELSQPGSPAVHGTDKTNAAGKWNINLNPTDDVVVEVAKRTVGKRGHKRRCEAASSGTIDVIGPAVAIVSPNDDDFTGSSGTIIYDVGDAVSVTCTLDGGPVSCDLSAGSTQFFQFSNRPDGEHTFTVTGTDSAGNATERDVMWNVDATPPSIQSLTVAGTGPNGEIQATISDQSHVETIYCPVDSSSLECGTGPEGGGSFLMTFALSGLAPGSHRVEVFAVDQWGNSSAEFVAAPAPAPRAFFQWTVTR